MNRIVLYEIPFNVVSLYQDSANAALTQATTEAKSSAQVRWAVENKCKVQVTTTTDNTTGDGSIIFYAALTPMQQTEFALRF